jgi:hypothetical protein
MVTQITHPTPGFTGTGVDGVEFTDGIAYTSSPHAISVYRTAGYGIGGNPPTAIDSRDIEVECINPPGTERTVDGVTEVYDQVGTDDAGRPTYGWTTLTTQVGTPLRDASVDPHEDDYLPPTNAGAADPHGPDVVSTQTPRNPRTWAP